PSHAAASDRVKSGEVAADDDLSIRLNDDLEDRVGGTNSHVAAAVQAAVRIETNEATNRGTVIRRESASDEYLAVRLDRDRVSREPESGAAKAGTNVERSVDASIGIESGDTGDRGSVELKELTADDYLSVLLDSDRIYSVVRSGARIERSIIRAVGVQPCDV